MYSRTMGFFLGISLDVESLSARAVMQKRQRKNLPTELKFLFEVLRNVAALFLDIVDDVRFVHQIPLSE